MNDGYTQALQEQCESWERMYNEVKEERDYWKERALEAEKGVEAYDDAQLRHV